MGCGEEGNLLVSEVELATPTCAFSLDTSLEDRNWEFGGGVDVKVKGSFLTLFLDPMFLPDSVLPTELGTCILPLLILLVGRSGSREVEATQLGTQFSCPQAPVPDRQQVLAGDCQFPNKLRATMESADWPWPLSARRRGLWQLPASLTRPASLRWAEYGRGEGGRKTSHPGAPRSALEPRPTAAGSPGTAPENPPGWPRARSHSDPGCAPFGSGGGARGEYLGTWLARGYGAHAPDTPSRVRGRSVLNLIVEGSWPSAHDRSFRVSAISCPAGRGPLGRQPLGRPYRSLLSPGI